MSWSTPESWLGNDSYLLVEGQSKTQEFKLKCPEIPILENYSKDPGAGFWQAFPSMALPTKPQTKVNVLELELMVNQVNSSASFSPSQSARACKVLNSLRNGASSHQKQSLPSCFVNNAKGTVKYGREVTDAVAYWVKNGFVAGPFDQPPLPRFRVNPIVAVVQDNKVRPVLNVSSPAGESFNNNIDKMRLEKVKMSSARNFGYTIRKCNRGALMSKSDLEAAYKQIPAPLSELRLQGFCWLNKFFIELDQIFGAISAVSNFDQLGHTKVDLAIVFSDIRRELVHRHLDDVPVVAPYKSDECRRFTEVYKLVCERLNLKLAPDCPEKSKAFSMSQQGKVLGVWFDTSLLSWNLPVEKLSDLSYSIKRVGELGLVEVETMQRLLGSLNNFGLMSPFMRGFRSCLYEDLSYSLVRNHALVRLSDQSKKDLLIWSKAISEEKGKLIIPRQPCGPPVYHKVFTSDAAGCADSMLLDLGQGAASVGLNEEGELCFAARLEWDKRMIKWEEDSNGKRFGSKTTLLEFVAILIPILLNPALFMCQHIVFETDNMACVFGWEKLRCKSDSLTTILIRALHMVSFRLGSVFHVRHVPRLSTWQSTMADRLTRVTSMTSDDKRLLSSFSSTSCPNWFSDWLRSPSEDWTLPIQFLNHVEKFLK